MSQKTLSADKSSAAAPHAPAGHRANQLGALLCWAVVFADIGTSVYYTPGILYHQFGQLAGFFVTLTLVAFVLLALKYAEVSVRFPEGGGVVTVSAHALNPWMGALGGMFILVDYFLTAAISSLSGLQYLQQVIPPIKPFVLGATIIVLVLLGVLNWWGIRESAMVSLVIAVAAFISDVVIIIAVVATVPLSEVFTLIGGIFHGSSLTPITLLTGFAGAFLAFSGLESISQLSPVMQRPRNRTVTIALSLVVITVGFTSPLLTILSTTLLDGRNQNLLAHPIPITQIDPNQFISQLGAATAGPAVGVATAIIASALLIFASNTAIIGTYHVFLALSRMSFFPEFVTRRDGGRDTPVYSIALATVIPILILLFANGQIDLLGQLYAFGLLGAFSLTCISMDVLRVRERRGGKHVTLHDEELEAEAEEDARLRASGAQPTRAPTTNGLDDDANDISDELLLPTAAPATPAAHAPIWGSTWQTARRSALRLTWQTALAWWRPLWRQYWPTINFGLGFLTTALVLSAWVTNLISKRDATIFGGTLTIVGMAIAITHSRWLESKGEGAIQPTWAISASPDSVFAIARAGSPENEAVIRSAFDGARGRKVMTLFLNSVEQASPHLMQITNEGVSSRDAQAAFRLTKQLSQELGVPAQNFYRDGSIASAVGLWQVARSAEVVADARTAREFAVRAAPIYIRFRRQGATTITHLILRARDDATPNGGAALTGLSPAAPARRPAHSRPTGATSASGDADGAGMSDESWEEVEQYREMEDAAPGMNGRAGAAAADRRAPPRPAESEDAADAAATAEPPSDHVHDEHDTAPRYHVKIVAGSRPASPSPAASPAVSGAGETKRPTPPLRPAPRIREPLPIESDEDDWEMVDDEPVLRTGGARGRHSHNGHNDAADDPPGATDAPDATDPQEPRE